MAGRHAAMKYIPGSRTTQVNRVFVLAMSMLLVHFGLFRVWYKNSDVSHNVSLRAKAYGVFDSSTTLKTVSDYLLGAMTSAELRMYTDKRIQEAMRALN